MKDVDKKLDEIYQGFCRGKEGDANANNSGLIALAFAIAHLADKLEKVSQNYRSTFEK